MLQLRYHRRWQAAGAFVLLCVLAGTLVPAIWLWPNFSKATFLEPDKWLHGITFAFLAVWFSGQYARRHYSVIGIGLLLFGIVIELCQRMLTYRSAEWMDLLADAVGIVIGLSIAVAGVGGWSLQFEERLARRPDGQ